MLQNPEIKDWLDLMPAKVTASPYLGANSYGQPSYGPAVTYQARVTYRNRRITNAAGEEVVARGEAWLATIDPITPKSKVQLDNGSFPLILSVDQVADETGPLFTKLYFA